MPASLTPLHTLLLRHGPLLQRPLALHAPASHTPHSAADALQGCVGHAALAVCLQQRWPTLHHPAGEGEPKKKGRKKKDPNAPKAGLSGFMFFSQAQRESVKADNPGIAFGEIGKVLGERWKALSAEGKAP